MNDGRIRVALVGTGAIAEQHHLPAIRELDDELKLVAAADVDEARVRDFCEKHLVAGVYTDVEEMLERERPALVHICTPPASHAALTVRCFRAGSWVFCEKPPCASLAELDGIEEAQEETGCYCSFVFQWRFGSGAEHVRRLIDASTFGRPLLALCQTTWFRDSAYYAEPWRGRWETEVGGPTVGHAIHAIDLMLWLLGDDWREVRAMLGRVDRAIETEDVSMAMVELAGGARANVVASVVSPREETYLRFDFQRATVELRHLYAYTNADWRLTLPPGEAGSGVKELWDRFPEERPSSHVSQLRSIVASMGRGDRPPAGPREVRPTMELVTALYRSAMTGVPVTRGSISPDDDFYRVLHGNFPEWAPAGV